jgi:hypothetical protein
MKSQTNDSLHLMIWTAAISVILFCATAAAAISGWVPFALGHTGDDPSRARVEWKRLEAAKSTAPRPAVIEASSAAPRLTVGEPPSSAQVQSEASR